MALNWDLSKVKDYETVCWTTYPLDEKDSVVNVFTDTWSEDAEAGTLRKLNAVTNAIIWAMMAINHDGTVTEKNALEVYLRAHAVETVFGASLLEKDTDTGESKPRYLTYEDVRAHIGLWTNAFGNKKRLDSFVNRLKKEERARAVAEDGS